MGLTCRLGEQWGSGLLPLPSFRNRMVLLACWQHSRGELLIDPRRNELSDIPWALGIPWSVLPSIQARDLLEKLIGELLDPRPQVFRKRSSKETTSFVLLTVCLISRRFVNERDNTTLSKPPHQPLASSSSPFLIFCQKPFPFQKEGRLMRFSCL